MSEMLAWGGTDEIASLPVPPTGVDATLITGDCRIVGWSLRSTVVGTAASGGLQDGTEAAIVAATAGNISLPNATDSLTGFAVTLSTVGTAAMTITVSNVVGGPYVYFLLTGAATLIVNFPTPLRSSGAAPNVAWTATAAAVGEIDIFGLTAAVAATGVQTIIELQDSGNILGEVSLAPGQAETDLIRPNGMPCQGQIKVHVVSGTVTGVVWAYLTRD